MAQSCPWVPAWDHWVPWQWKAAGTHGVFQHKGIFWSSQSSAVGSRALPGHQDRASWAARGVCLPAKQRILIPGASRAQVWR